MIHGVDFVTLPCTDLEAASAFYRDTLGLRRSVYKLDRHYSEYETDNLTLSVIDAEKMGIDIPPSRAPLALNVDDVAAARAALEERGVVFGADTLDTGVCHMAFFSDPGGNALMLHSRYAPRETEG